MPKIMVDLKKILLLQRHTPWMMAIVERKTPES